MLGAVTLAILGEQIIQPLGIKMPSTLAKPLGVAVHREREGGMPVSQPGLFACMVTNPSPNQS